MRFVLAVAAAAVAAGFTVQDAERALDGEWAGISFPVGLAIDGANRTATLTDGGKAAKGSFVIETASGGAVTVAIAGRRYIVHVRDGGDTLHLSAEGQSLTRILKRVR